jgi:hypothetical protein
MKTKDQILLEKAYQLVLEADLQNTIGAVGTAIGDASLEKIPVYFSKGEPEEGLNLLKKYIKDQIKIDNISIWLNQNVKPIKGATTSSILNNIQYKEWLTKSWLPYIKGQINSSTSNQQPTNNKSLNISDELAAKQIFDKIKGTPNLTISTIKQYVKRYLPMVNKNESDIDYLSALVYSELQDFDKSIK